MTNQPLIAGMGGYVGLDFALFEPICNSYGVPIAERRGLFSKLLILNRISGRYWREQEKQERERSEAEAKLRRSGGH